MVTSENASKRHLPPWMLPKVAAATIPVRNTVSAEKNRTSDKEAIAEAPDLTENAEIALKKAGAGQKRQTSRRKSYSHEKCEIKRRRKFSEQDASSDGNATQKDKKKRDNSKYVKDYEKKKRKEASNSQCESVKQFPTTGEYGNSLDSHCERKKDLYSSTSNKAGELVTTRTFQAGDPAQGMMELLLGPLLKPLEEEKNKSIIEIVDISQETPGKSQAGFSGEDKVPLTKRKCCLKDEVRLFLD